MTSRCRLAVFAALLVGLPLGSTARSQEEEAPIKVILYPAAAPRPALKYRLTPEFIDRLPGNAAVYYGKVKFEQSAFFNNRELRDNADRWQVASLEELRRDQARMPFPNDYVEQAARCTFCDWQLPVLKDTFEGILLPEVQEVRQFARYLAAQIRIDVAHGEYDAAIKRLQISYAMARNVAKGETLINGLVGAAICTTMAPQALELLQQPDAPNLYWAISTLPRPMIDFRDAVEAQSNIFEIILPELRYSEQSGRSAEQWRSTLLKLWEGVNQGLSFGGQPRKQSAADFGVACLRNYPLARHALLQRGWTSDDVAQLPVAQVILIDAMAQYRELTQDAVVAFHLPYPAAVARFKDVSDRISDLERDQRPAVLVTTWGSEALMACRLAQVRVERQLAVLRVLEALRMHAASHNGALPQRLSDVTEAPVPNDPVTEAPFQYEANGMIATLRGPTLVDTPLNYKITMASAAK